MVHSWITYVWKIAKEKYALFQAVGGAIGEKSNGVSDIISAE